MDTTDHNLIRFVSGFGDGGFDFHLQRCKTFNHLIRHRMRPIRSVPRIQQFICNRSRTAQVFKTKGRCNPPNFVSIFLQLTHQGRGHFFRFGSIQKFGKTR